MFRAIAEIKFRFYILLMILRGRVHFFSTFIKGRNIQIGSKPRIDKDAEINGRAGQIRIGNDVEIGKGVVISSHGGPIQIGDQCSFNPYCVIYGHGGLKIGDRVRIAAHTVIIPANHGFEQIGVPIAEQPLNKKGIVIGSDCWIGAGVRILDGVHIGDGSVIGAGAVVTKDIPSNSVAVGVPAKVVQTRSRA